jgi:hypothetical protein
MIKHDLEFRRGHVGCALRRPTGSILVLMADLFPV